MRSQWDGTVGSAWHVQSSSQELESSRKMLQALREWSPPEELLEADSFLSQRRGVAAQVNGLREWKEVEKLLALATTALFVWPLCPLLIAARPSLLRECEI